jgi:transposase-like protein
MMARSCSMPKQGRGYTCGYDASAIAAKLEIVERFRKDGMRIFEISRRLGVSDTTIYNWRKQHAKPPRKAVEREIAALRLEIAHMRARLDLLNPPSNGAGP